MAMKVETTPCIDVCMHACMHVYFCVGAERSHVK